MLLDNQLPAEGFIRLEQIVGNKKKGIPPIIPICKASWYKGVQTGKYPRSLRLGKKTSVYRVEDIRKLLEQIGNEEVEVA